MTNSPRSATTSPTATEPPAGAGDRPVRRVPPDGSSSTGLSPRVGAVLAYSGWWVSGLLMWWVERRDLFVRFHAAQAMTALGGIALLVVLFAGMAVLSLQLLPRAFVPLMATAGAMVVAGTLLWAVATLRAAQGGQWRMPIVGRLAERLARAGAEESGR